MNYKLISVILPVYNQADHIVEIVEEYEATLSRIQTPCEVLLVVNGSQDNSLEVCQKLAERFPVVRVIHEPKKGWGMAVKRGIKEARGDLLCYTNSARTSAGDLALFLLYAIAFPEVVVKANRKVRASFRRRIGSLLYNLECRTLFDLSYWDINGTPKVFPRRFEQLLLLSEENDMIDAEFNVVCKRNNYPMVEVPVFSTKRHGGKSTTRYSSAFKMYWGAYKLWRKMRAGS